MPPTTIKDKATATEAALNLNKGSEIEAPKPGEPNPPRTKSTSEVLFPEFVTDDGGIINRPVKPFEDKGKQLPSGSATPAPASAPPTPPASAPTAPGYLDLSKLPENTMVRLKVDGVEMDVPVREALKSVQLERHLTQKAQQLADREKALEDERRRMVTPPAPSAIAPTPDPAAGAPQPTPKPPANTPESQRIAQLEADLAAIRAQVAPQIFQAGLKRLDDHVKATLGADDFMTYAPKIQAFVDSELARPEVKGNPTAMQQLDSQSFWFAKYQEMKIRDMMAGRTPAPTAPTPSSPVVAPVVIPAGATAVVDRNGNIVPIPVIDGSAGVPSRTTPEADWQGRYQAAFARAKETGRTEDWQEVFRLKRESTPS